MLELLEDRLAPAQFTVANLNDAGGGSLRDAVAQANSSAGADDIVFQSGLTGTIVLTSGQLDVSGDLAVQGPGAGALNVSGNNASRVWRIQAGVVATINDLTITGGRAALGGGILNEGTLTANRLQITQNTAFGDVGGFNSITDGAGGGVFNDGVLVLASSAIFANDVFGTGTLFTALRGAGVYNRSNATIVNCTVDGNTFSGHIQGPPGGIGFGAGGIDSDGTARVVNSTVVNNQGQGITATEVVNTIVAGNTGTFTGLDVTATTVRNSLVGRDFTLQNGVNGNIVGNGGTTIDPLLGPLQNNGGSTSTHALLAGSPAVNTGDNAAITNPPFAGPPFTDQRGTGFARILNGSVDMGAFESTLGEPPDFDDADLVVTKTDSADPVRVGDDLTYTMTVHNNGPDSAGNVVLTDTLPANVVFVSATGSATPVNGVLTFNLGTIASGAEKQVQIVVRPTTPKRLTNTASATSNAADANAANNTGIMQTTDVCSLVVNTTLDVVDPTDDVNSLREAILCANMFIGADVISLPSGTYTLTRTGTGEDQAQTGDLDITDDLVILGAGAATTIVQGGASVAAAVDRVFDIITPVEAARTDASLSGLTIRHGLAQGFGGGGIHTSRSNLAVTDAVISNNATTSGNGGGIVNFFGSVFLSRTVVDGNTADGDGAGIATFGGPTPSTLIVEDCTISNNRTTGFLHLRAGGGIYNDSDTLLIQRSTISGNTSIGEGGGLWSNGAGAGQVASIVNSTISGNVAVDGGGGIYYEATGETISTGLELLNVTIALNQAAAGGGIDVDSERAGGSVRLTNTIVARNRLGTTGAPSGGAGSDVQGPITSGGHNLLGNGDGSFFAANTGDKIGTSASVIDPLLNGLANNGGLTQTHALSSNSPAIDAGDDAAAAGLATDQRGNGFARKHGPHVDIGAFEAPPRAQADLRILITAPSQVRVGSSFNVILTVNNLGTAAATGVVLNNLIDANSKFIKAVVGKGSFTVADGVLRWTIGALAVGASTKITITLRALNVGNIALDASVAGAEFDPNTGNNSVKKIVAVLRRPRLSLWLPDLRTT